MKMEKAIYERQQTYDSNVNADMRLASYQSFKNDARECCHISDLFHVITSAINGLVPKGHAH
ncbi:hypothetical protein SAMN06296386_11491 [Lachnospiraceae bacterium]|nr:hypothetical protein SAMN06296386_11491 [Lachnospiraceae bacterium]